MSEEEKDESASPDAPGPSTDEGTATDAAPKDAPGAEPAAAPSGEPGESPSEAGPRKKKAKKEARAADDSPEGKELREAEVAFEVGDYRRARELATKLAGSSRAAIADAARDLLRRTDVDPVQMGFLALCACAILGIAYYYLGH